MNKIIKIDDIEYYLVPVDPSEDDQPMYDDWRLPTIQELLNLINYEKSEPACDLEDTSSDGYWSATTHQGNSELTWVVGFSNGYVGGDNKDCRRYVRCVRNGDNGLEWSKSSTDEMTWDEAAEYAKSLSAPVYYTAK